eukprot:753636-Pyramimonas_sp.AAC.1
MVPLIRHPSSGKFEELRFILQDAHSSLSLYVQHATRCRICARARNRARAVSVLLHNWRPLRAHRGGGA